MPVPELDQDLDEFPDLFRAVSSVKKKILQDFPGGAVAKNLLANARDTGSIPGLGEFHLPQSN